MKKIINFISLRTIVDKIQVIKNAKNLYAYIYIAYSLQIFQCAAAK